MPIFKNAPYKRVPGAFLAAPRIPGTKVNMKYVRPPRTMNVIRMLVNDCKRSPVQSGSILDLTCASTKPSGAVVTEIPNPTPMTKAGPNLATQLYLPKYFAKKKQ